MYEKSWNLVLSSTEIEIGEEKCGSTSDSDCCNQIFVLKQLCGKTKEKKQVTYLALMDLEEAYGRVDRKAQRYKGKTPGYRLFNRYKWRHESIRYDLAYF